MPLPNINANTTSITDASSERTDIRAAVNTFYDSMQTVFTTYGTPDKEKVAFEEALIDLCRDLEARMRVTA